MTPQLAAYILIAVTFSPVAIVGIWVWWELRDEVEAPEVEDHTVLIGRVGWHPSIGNFVEWTACDPAAEAEQILREDAA